MAGKRACVFVDANNWYHGLDKIGVGSTASLDYRRVCEKLATSAREWIGMRWYVGQIQQTTDRAELYRNQRKFLDQLRNQDPRISVHLGRIVKNEEKNEAAQELEHYLGGLKSRLDPEVYGHLFDIARRHRMAHVYVEKEVDVMLALDLVEMAINDQYDVAYLLTADGDLAPAARFVAARGKDIFAVHPKPGHEISKACAKVDPVTGSIGAPRSLSISREWIDDLRLPPRATPARSPR